MKIVTANRPKKHKCIQHEGKVNAEDNAGLCNHQDGATGNKKTGENEKVDEPTEQNELDFFQGDHLRFNRFAFVLFLVGDGDFVLYTAVNLLLNFVIPKTI